MGRKMLRRCREPLFKGNGDFGDIFPIHNSTIALAEYNTLYIYAVVVNYTCG